jgi:hypothetical protein
MGTYVDSESRHKNFELCNSFELDFELKILFFWHFYSSNVLIFKLNLRKYFISDQKLILCQITILIQIA